MHKITKHVMPAEEAIAPTPCALDPERWFPDEQKPDPYAVASCWEGCYFQRSCARRALSEPQPEHGVWGGYRLAPGPGLERTRAQLAIVAGYEMGPSLPPSVEVTAALLDIAALQADDDIAALQAAEDAVVGALVDSLEGVDAVATVDPYYWSGAEPADLDTAEPTDLDVDRHGQTVLFTGLNSPRPSQRPTLTSRCGGTRHAADVEHLQIALDLAGAGPASAGTSRRAS